MKNVKLFENFKTSPEKGNAPNNGYSYCMKINKDGEIICKSYVHDELKEKKKFKKIEAAVKWFK